MITAKRRAARRGVLLLVVLSMLAIFSLISIAYVVIATQEERMADAFQKMDRHAYSPGDDLHGGVMQLFRGASHFNSVLAPHSLLEDLYGNDSIRGHILPPRGYYLPSSDPGNPRELHFGANPPLRLYQPAQPLFGRNNNPQFPANGPPLPFWSSGQLLEFSVIFFPDMLAQLYYTPAPPSLDFTTNPTELEQWANAETDEARRRVGCVLTMLDGPAKGKSTRIVGFRRYPRDLVFPAGAQVMENRLQVVAFEGVDPSDVGNYIGRNGGRFVINGTPFSGTGFGINFDEPTPIDGPTGVSGSNPDPVWLDARDVGLLTERVAGGRIDLFPGTNGAGLSFALRPNPTAPTSFGAYYDSTNMPQPLSPPRVVREFPLHLQGWDDRPGNWVDRPGNGSNLMASDDVAANEDYDAVDYQNMALAMIVPQNLPALNLARGEVPIPSFHRPALINYQLTRLAGSPTTPGDLTIVYMDLPVGNRPSWPAGWTPQQKWNAVLQPGAILPDPDMVRRIIEFKRKFILRPMSDDHPDFDGSNPLPTGVTLSDMLLGRDTSVPPDGAPDQFFWDVDNDGDGFPDSIWVDLGMPVRTAKDGRKFKPLYAFLCTDLDGRLNLNAHGSPEQLRPQYASQVIPNPSDGRIFANNFTQNLPGSPVLPDIGLPYGQGFGPPEINLLPVLGNLGYYQNLLLGNGPAGGNLLDGRYGEANRRPLLPQLHFPAPGRSEFRGNPYNDFLSANKLFGFPWNYRWAVTNNPAATGSYGTPGDLKGSMVVGLDLRGQPVYRVLRSVPAAVNSNGFVFGWSQAAWDAAPANDPYELNLARKGAGSQSTPAPEDHPFTVAELEQILRPFDADHGALPDRVFKLLMQNPALYARRHELTTDSWDLPTPNLAYNRNLRDDFLDENETNWPGPDDLEKLPRPRHMSDLLAIVLRAHEKLQDQNAPLLTPQQIARRATQLLPMEMLRGIRMNVNRPFGNGVDDELFDTSNPPDGIPDVGSNGVVDDPGERFELARANRLEGLLQWDALGNPVTTPFPFDHDNDGDDRTPDPDFVFAEHGENYPNPNGNLPPIPNPNCDPYAWNRQLHARHLYVLAMLLVDQQWYPPYEDPTPPPPLTQRQHEEVLRARALAQWAVNVVDFYDRDSIMTPFEYDLFPFRNPSASDPHPNNQRPDRNAPANPSDLNSTWDVDGRINPSTYPSPPPSPLLNWMQDYSYDDIDNNFNRGVVWGCERPELLITETLAFHDRRTENLPFDGGEAGGTPADNNDDFDQRYVPQGSLFLELFNPWTDDEARPGEFYYNRNSNFPLGWRKGVVLNQRSPGAPGKGSPVWRLAIVGPDLATNNNLMSPDPNIMALDPDGDTPPEIERSVYFCKPPDPSGNNPDAYDANDGTLFYPSLIPGNTDRPIAPILPNHYAVIGSADPDDTNPTKTTYIGFNTTSSPPRGDTSTRRIELTHPDNGVGQVAVFGDGSQDDLDRPAPAAPHTVVEAPQTGWGPGGAIKAPVAVAIDQPRRLSVSEPTDGYSGTISYNQNVRGYIHGTVAAPTIQAQPDDLTSSASDPDLWPEYLGKNVTIAQFRTVHLQRLADPTRAFDPKTNPYRTIDSAQIDLTTFNGIDSQTVTPDLTAVPPVLAEVPLPPGSDTYVPIPNPAGFMEPPWMMATRERGEMTMGMSNLWAAELAPAAALPQSKRYRRWVTSHHFKLPFAHTLGYVNEAFGNPRVGPFDAGTGVDYVGAPYTPDYDDADGDGDRLEPATTQNPPFPWLTWNNRPFVSQLELLLVPGVRSSRLLKSFAMTGSNPYVRPPQGAVGTGPFPHLSNLLEAEPGASAEVAAQLHRVLEFLQVPSRFVGTETQINPVAAALEAPPSSSPPSWAHPSHGFHPPFNRISRYRDPGRVNLNTIFSPAVWLGLGNSLPGTSFGNFAWSRQGYPNVNPLNPLVMDAAIPTRFANPFRSSSGMYMVPTNALRDAARMLSFNPTGSEINATLLRENPDPTAPNQPLLARGIPPWPTGEFNNQNRSPYFRYQSLQRLGNLVTTRSNVYAVWVTVGYFEVSVKEKFDPTDPTEPPVDRNVYLEGYTLGRELGIDTGEVERHRAFYVFDRSIPVAFERGRDHNVDKAIVLKRFIE